MQPAITGNVNRHAAALTHPSHINQTGHQSKQILGRVATQLQTIREQSSSQLQRQLQIKLHPDQYRQIEPLFQYIEMHSDFSELSDRVRAFINENQQNPEAITNCLKYVNSQLMILSGAERLLNSELSAERNPLEQGLNKFLESFGAQGDGAVEKLAQITVSPVLTAHPTSFSRPQASAIVLSQIADLMNPHDNPAVFAKLLDAQGVRETKPTVSSEAEQFRGNIQYLHGAGRSVHKTINQQLAKLSNNTGLTKPLVESGNWVAGDRDGNPNIDAKVLHDVVKTLSAAAFQHYEQKIGEAKNTQLGSLCNLLCRAGNSELVSNVQAKLLRTRQHLLNEAPLPIQGDLYQDACEIHDDLEKADLGSLKTEDRRTVFEKLALLKLDTDGIGFHGASTDIRQNSAMNEKTVHELLQRSGVTSNYSSLNETGRQQVLTNVLTSTKDISLVDLLESNGAPATEFEREIQLVKSYKQIHDTFGPKALKNCITANTETMSDMLEVMVLLKHAGLADENGIRMNVVPLIETVNDLHNGPNILKSMLGHSWYGKALEQSGNVQQVMVGYSDSNRLDGPLASSWAVYQGTAKMLEVAEQHGVKLHVFHGRGGTEARGSGDSYSQEIKSTNGASMQTGTRQTEQGEEVGAKFGNKTLSKSNLADMVGSTLETMSGGADQHLVKYATTMDKLANSARDSYATLYNNSNLPVFLQSSTPIDFVGQSNAGSRPASRATAPGQSLNLDKLRAIPWVGSWYQSGSAMPAFYGTGSALESFVNARATGNKPPIQELQTMYAEWPFFKSFIDRTSTAMAKADMQVAQQYAQLAPANTQQVFNMIQDEFKLTENMIAKIRGTNDLQSHNPDAADIQSVKKSLTNAAHAMQIGLLRAHHQAGPEIRKQLAEPIVMSMQAIANANRFG